MSKATLVQPKFLKLDQTAKQNILGHVNTANIDEPDKQIIKEYLLFADVLKEQLQDSSITLQQVKKLFEAFSKKIQAAQ